MKQLAEVCDRCSGGEGDFLAIEEQAIAEILQCADILCSGEQLGFDLPAGGQQISTELLEAVGLSADQLALVRDGLLESTEEAESVFCAGS